MPTHHHTFTNPTFLVAPLSPWQANLSCSSWSLERLCGTGGGGAWQRNQTTTSSGALQTTSQSAARAGKHTMLPAATAAAGHRGRAAELCSFTVHALWLALWLRAGYCFNPSLHLNQASCCCFSVRCERAPPLTWFVLHAPCAPSACCRYALWLDADLHSGLSRNSTTFGNDSLAGAEEFKAGLVELWGLS